MMQQREFEENVHAVLRKYIRPALSHFESRIIVLEKDNQNLREMLANWETDKSKQGNNQIQLNSLSEIIISSFSTSISRAPDLPVDLDQMTLALPRLIDLLESMMFP